MLRPNVLVFDIEISQGIYAAYPSKKPQYLSSRQMLADQHWICASYQWEDAKRINNVSVLDDMKSFKKNKYDIRDFKWHDFVVVKELYDQIIEADMVVGHNIKNFDWKKFLAKCIEYDLKPPKEVKFFDTLTMARKAGFSYNDLGFLAKKLGLENKMEAPDWTAVLMGDADQIKYTSKYCSADIPPAMGLYKKFRPYFPTQFNHNLLRGDGVKCCPVCGCTEYTHRGKRFTAVGVYQAYECKDCGKRFQDGKRLKGVAMR